MKYSIIVFCALATFTIAPQAHAQEDNWSGAYVGVYAGANAGTNEFRDYWCWSACDAPNINVTKPVVGGTVGLNLQADEHLVVGVEADFGTGFKHTLATPSAATSTYQWTTNVKWQSTIRARAGLSSGNTLAYVTGGYAIANADLSERTDSTQTGGGAVGVAWGAKFSGNLSGYAYGGGIEHRLGPVSAKIEVLRETFGTRDACYMDLEGASAGTCWATARYSNPKSVSFTTSSTNLRVGLNYKF